MPNPSPDDQRQLLYSSVLRYTSEPITLRERVLDRVVLGGLIGSTQIDPFRIGRINDNIRFGKAVLSLRTETIQETLDRLILGGTVEKTEAKKRRAYYLTDEANKQIASVTNVAQQDFDTALKRLLTNTEHLLDYDIAAEICRRFILECYARFGQIMAKSVTGHIKSDELPRVLDTRDAFRTAVEGHKLSAGAIDSLRTRCNYFLKSADPHDQKVKFHLSQGYYFTQLLGFEDSGFNPLRDHALSEAVFYLDTNVIIIGVVYVDEDSALFDEMVRVTKRMNIELKVTTATINEARRVAHDRLKQIKKILDVVPEEIVERTDDQFILAYLHAKAQDAALTPEKFVEPFEHLADLLKERWNITIDDTIEDDIIAIHDISEICRIIHEEAEKTRGWGKSDAVQKHDACHYVLVTQARTTHSKTWFLTRDRTLVSAAYRLQPDTKVLFCFSLVGFLHSISPFISTSEEENTIVSALAAFMSDQVFAIGPVFDIAELAILAEFHDDVMSTPADQLLLALDYVKSKTLEGKPYRTADIPKVSLELRKFLSSSKDEQYRALELERLRLETVVQAEEKCRRAAENRALSLEQARDAQQKQLSETELAASNSRQSAYWNRLKFRGLLAALGIAAGAGLWLNSHSLAVWLTTANPITSNWMSLSAWQTVFNGCAALICAWPAFSLVLATNIRDDIRTAILVVVGAVVLGASHFLSESHLSFWSNVFGVATPLVLLILVLRRNRHRSEGGVSL
jgi:hypothetical protein